MTEPVAVTRLRGDGAEVECPRCRDVYAVHHITYDRAEDDVRRWLRNHDCAGEGI